MLPLDCLYYSTLKKELLNSRRVLPLKITEEKMGTAGLYLDYQKKRRENGRGNRL